MDLDRIEEAARRMSIRPFAAFRLMRMVDDPNVSLAELAEVVEMDPVSSSKVIRMANSVAHGGGGRPIASAERAVSRLGSSTVKAVVAAGAVSLLSPDAELGPADRWVHSVAVGAAASEVAECLGVSARDAYTAGLLHDIGSDIYPLVASPDPGGQPLAGLPDPEVDHSEIGAGVVQRWGFPAILVEAIRDHHRPVESVGPLTKAVILGESLAATLEPSTCSEEIQPLESLLGSLKLSTNVKALKERTRRKYEKVGRAVEWTG